MFPKKTFYKPPDFNILYTLVEIEEFELDACKKPLRLGVCHIRFNFRPWPKSFLIPREKHVPGKMHFALLMSTKSGKTYTF